MRVLPDYARFETLVMWNGNYKRLPVTQCKTNEVGRDRLVDLCSMEPP